MFERVGEEENFGQEEEEINSGGCFFWSTHPYTLWISRKTVWIVTDEMKKVLMMDSRTFNRLTTPKDKVLTSIEGEMSSILNDDSIPEDVKAKLYSSAQSRFLKIEHPQLGETTAVTKPFNSPDFVLDTLPQKLVERAKLLASILKNTNRVSINNKNELLIDGEVIPGSNATELYLDVLKRRPNTSSGYDRFEQLVQESGRPNDIPEKPSTRQSRGLSRAQRDSSVDSNPPPSVYVTPGFPNTQGRKKIKFDTLFK